MAGAEETDQQKETSDVDQPEEKVSKTYIVFVMPLRQMFMDIREVLQYTKGLFR